MKNIIIRSAILPFSAAILLFSPWQATAADTLDSLDLDLNLAYRVDQLDWNIAGNINGTNPSIISELTWEKLRIAEISGRVGFVLGNKHLPFGVGLRANANYGQIQDGENQDSDYQYDDRTFEWSRSNNGSDDGSVLDLTIGLGPVFKLRASKFIISPLFGYSYHSQKLTIQDGFQTISRDNPFSPYSSANPPAVGPIAGLDSTYDAEWRSGWGGADLQYRPLPSLEVHAGVEFHSAEYKAQANWNLRTDLSHPKSFDQDTNDASGWVTTIGTKYGVGRMRLNAEVRYQRWQAEYGIDRTYFANGTSATTRLNEVNWESLSVAVGMAIVF